MLISVDGIPAHPLVVHAVVVLLPLAALGGLAIAVLPSWRRRFGLALLVLAAVGIGSVPVATRTGGQLKEATSVQGEVIDRHQDLGESVLLYGLAFGVAMLLLVIAGRLADRERTAAGAAGTDAQIEASDQTSGAPARVTRTWQRIAVVASVLVVVTSVAVTVQVVRTGHSGSASHWEWVTEQD